MFCLQLDSSVSSTSIYNVPTGYLSPETYQTILSLITYVLREFLLLRHMLLRNVLTLRFIVIDEPLLKRLGFARQFSILFIIPF